MRIALSILLATILSACNQVTAPAVVTCGTKPADSSMSALEQKVLGSSIERSSEACGSTGNRCHFTVHTLEHEILVFGQLAPLKAGHCNRVSGGDWIDKYASDGRFKERVLGM
jgi:hypothetical protein